VSANVGEMFYTGHTPWHELGVALAQPATLEEALKVGGLNWQVGEVELMTAEDPPSLATRRKALVRLDRPPGHPGRVVGVAHQGFVPIQNADAAMLFDAVFGDGRRVYHTGGYLGIGEVIWLLARIDRTLRIGRDDIVEPYALMANSHDGSTAFSIRLTTIRVVCQNTLALAMRERIGQHFRRSHQGSFAAHAEAAREFFQATLHELDFVAQAFTHLSKQSCDDEQFEHLLEALLPEPRRPRNGAHNPVLQRRWERQVAEVRATRATISRLRQGGKGASLDSARGTLWGALNAVLEYVDHHRPVNGSRVPFALLGDGMDLKVRAFRLIRESAGAA
jgi:phage/plasmid-like protein (TIGR03299 family)